MSLASRNNISNSNKALHTPSNNNNSSGSGSGGGSSSQKGHHSDLFLSRHSTNDLPNIPPSSSSSSTTTSNAIYTPIPSNKKASSLKLTRSSSHPITLPSSNIHTLPPLASKPSHSSLQTTGLKINLAEFIVMEMLRSEL